MGNLNANILVTVFSNPHCNPCAKLHKRIEEILQNEENNLCFQYIFTAFNEELKASSKALLSAYLDFPRGKAGEIISEWFDSGKNNKEEFFKKYELDPERENVVNEFDKHVEWNKDAGLHATPTILVNGFLLPDNYRIEDLKYFKSFD